MGNISVNDPDNEGKFNGRQKAMCRVIVDTSASFEVKDDVKLVVKRATLNYERKARLVTLRRPSFSWLILPLGALFSNIILTPYPNAFSNLLSLLFPSPILFNLHSFCTPSAPFLHPFCAIPAISTPLTFKYFRWITITIIALFCVK